MLKIANQAGWWLMIGGVVSVAMIGATLRRAVPVPSPPAEWAPGGPPALVLPMYPPPDHTARPASAQHAAVS